MDLSGLVSLPYGRIAIVQDVTGSNNRGTASYKIDRSCGGVGALPPTIAGGGPGIYTTPGGKVVATLFEGRFTVHSSNFANFGPGANYLAVARSVTSRAVDGCSVSVTIEGVPAACTVVPSTTQTLTWQKGSPFEHFDFEFDIACGAGAAVPVAGDGLPPAPPGSSDSAGGDSSDAVAPAGADVRIVARKLANGKIEFGLQQQRNDDSWGDRRLPRARLFPATAQVGQWLRSTPLTVSVASSADALAENIGVRIIARKTSSGRVEFGLQQRDDDGSWGDRQLPSRRFFPTGATVDRWLVSSPLTLDG